MSALAEFCRDVKELSAGRIRRLANAIFSGEKPDGTELENLSPDEVEAIGRIVEGKSKQQRAEEEWQKAGNADQECKRLEAAIRAATEKREALYLGIREHDFELFNEIEELKKQLILARDNYRSAAAQANRAEEFAMAAEAEQVGA